MAGKSNPVGSDKPVFYSDELWGKTNGRSSPHVERLEQKADNVAQGALQQQQRPSTAPEQDRPSPAPETTRSRSGGDHSFGSRHKRRSGNHGSRSMQSPNWRNQDKPRSPKNAFAAFASNKLVSPTIKAVQPHPLTSYTQPAQQGLKLATSPHGSHPANGFVTNGSPAHKGQPQSPHGSPHAHKGQPQSPHGSPHGQKSPHTPNGSPSHQSPKLNGSHTPNGSSSQQAQATQHSQTLKGTKKHIRNGLVKTWEEISLQKRSEFTLRDCVTAIEVISEFPCKKAGDWLKDFWPKNQDTIRKLFIRAEELVELASANLLADLLTAISNLQEFPTNSHKYAELHAARGELFEAISARAQSQVANYSAGQLCALAKGCEAAGFDDDLLLTAICNEVVATRQNRQKLDAFDLDNFNALFHALAKLGFAHQEILSTMVGALQKLPTIGENHLAPLIWSLTILLNLHDESQLPIPQDTIPFLVTLLKQFDQRKGLHTSINLSQVCPACYYLPLCQKTPLVSDCPELFKQMQAWEKGKACDFPKSSRLHADVQDWMKDSRNIPNLCRLIPERFVAGYNLDITIDKGAKEKFAIEVDGPSHSLNSGRRPGNERLRHTILTALGWKVEHVSSEAWKRGALATQGARQEFMRNALSPSPSPSNRSRSSSGSPSLNSSKGPSPTGRSTPGTPGSSNGQSTPRTPQPAQPAPKKEESPLPVYRGLESDTSLSGNDSDYDDEESELSVANDDGEYDHGPDGTFGMGLVQQSQANGKSVSKPDDGKYNGKA